MRWRVLPVEEWPRLDAAGAETVWRLLDPARAQILVVEDGGAIVGTVTLLPVIHAECLWIAPSHRRAGGVMRRLLRGLWPSAAALGVKALWAGSITPAMDDVLRRIGASVVPGRSFVFPVKGT